MKGYIELSKENGTALCKQCINAMLEYPYEYEGIIETVWFGLKKNEYKLCKNMPHWYSYKSALDSKLISLMKMLIRGDPVYISLTCYAELIKLSEGDKRANAVFILNY